MILSASLPYVLFCKSTIKNRVILKVISQALLICLIPYEFRIYVIKKASGVWAGMQLHRIEDRTFWMYIS